MEKKIIDHCVIDVAKHLNVTNQDEIIITKDLLNQIKEINTDCYELLQDLLNTNNNYEFFSVDKEFRIKMPDLWREQKEKFYLSLKTAVEQFIIMADNFKIKLTCYNDLKEFLDN
ncbi:MAG: hypothetical protein Kow0068_25590 [Marinilabiliales bacterium]